MIYKMFSVVESFKRTTSRGMKRWSFRRKWTVTMIYKSFSVVKFGSYPIRNWVGISVLPLFSFSPHFSVSLKSWRRWYSDVVWKPWPWWSSLVWVGTGRSFLEHRSLHRRLPRNFTYVSITKRAMKYTRIVVRGKSPTRSFRAKPSWLRGTI